MLNRAHPAIPIKANRPESLSRRNPVVGRGKGALSLTGGGN